jgi:CheY-like chemotaxis protein
MGNFGLIISLVAILCVVAVFVFVRSKRPKNQVERQAPRVPPSSSKSDIDFEPSKLDVKLRDVDFGIKPEATPEKPRVDPAQTPSADRVLRKIRAEPASVQAPSPAAPVQREPARVEPPSTVVKPQPVVVPPAPKQAPAVRLAPMIYVVDDSAVVRVKMLRLLTGAGYRVQSGNDGVMGLALMNAGLPDLLITDLEMPEMDGHALIAALHADAALQRVPVVAISGHDGVREQLAGFSNVVDAFKKPWDDPVLLSKLEKLVGRGIPQ